MIEGRISLPGARAGLLEVKLRDLKMLANRLRQEADNIDEALDRLIEFQAKHDVPPKTVEELNENTIRMIDEARED